jgi:hypothetical protein
MEEAGISIHNLALGFVVWQRGSEEERFQWTKHLQIKRKPDNNNMTTKK